MVSVLVQIPQNSSTVGAYPVATGAGSGMAAPGDYISTTLQLPTVIRALFGMSSIISVQNVETTPITVTLTLYDESGSAVTFSPYNTFTHIPPGSSVYYDLYNLPLATGFSGSGKLVGTGRMYALITELSFRDYLAHASEAIARGATIVYAPEVRCDSRNSDTSFAVRNLGTTTATVDVHSEDAYVYTTTIPANGKASIEKCKEITTSFIGAATIESTQPIVVAAKTRAEGLYESSYTAIPIGGRIIALPFIRWTQSHWGTGLYRNRTYISIQNVGTSAITDKIEIHFLDRNGDLVFTDETTAALAPGERVEFDSYNASYPTSAEFGYSSFNNIFGGSAIIEGPSGSSLAAVVRVDRLTSPPGLTENDDILVSEQYPGIRVNLNAADIP